MHLVDWFPTICAIAGVDYTEYINYTLDGVNQWDGLSRNVRVNDSYFEFRDTLWYGSSHTFPNTTAGCCPVSYDQTGMRYKWWKMINGTGGQWDGWYPPLNCTHEKRTEIGEDYLGFQLYDIESDPGEHYNVADSNKQVVREMKAMMEKMERGGVAQIVDDASCPAQTSGHNPVVGQTTIPWC